MTGNAILLPSDVMEYPIVLQQQMMNLIVVCVVSPGGLPLAGIRRAPVNRPPFLHQL